MMLKHLFIYNCPFIDVLPQYFQALIYVNLLICGIFNCSRGCFIVMWCLIASFHPAFCASTWVRTIIPVPVLPDPKDMNDTPPDHPARHEAWHSQWKCPNRVPLINGQLPYPTGAFRAPSSPACALRVANQRAGSITNSLLRKGEWRSYCRCIDTPCFSHMTWNYIFFKAFTQKTKST